VADPADGTIRRILIIDDNPEIHQDFRTILQGTVDSAELDALNTQLFGGQAKATRASGVYELGFASQGQEGFELAQQARNEGKPYHLAFVDMRMPPGWDGLETIERIWQIDPDIEIVICTAYSDRSWEEIVERLGATDRLLILKKPFDTVEVAQLASALTEKLHLRRHAAMRMAEMDRLVEERTHELAATNDSLRQSEERYRLLADHASDVIWTMDREARFTYISPSVSRVLGYSPPELLSQDLSDISRNGAATEVMDQIRQRVAKRAYEPLGPLEVEHVCKDGSRKWCEMNVNWIRDEEGGLRSILGITRDVSARKTLEEQLRRAHRLESVGTLASGVAHNFNNILGIILGNAELARMELKDSNGVVKLLDEVVHASERAAALAQQLLAIARQRPGKKSVTAVGPLLKTVSQAMRVMLNSNIRTQVGDTAGLPSVEANHAELEQALMNICLNARDAMPKGGTISIAGRLLDLPSEASGTNPQATPGPYLCIAIRDTGIGMDTDVVSSIFDPFFTTKGPDKGIGLGLATTNATIVNHGGWIDVESEVGKGSTFRVYLPAVCGTEHRPGRPAAAAPTRGHETILVVDDEQGILDMAERSLTALGYTVLTATDGREAVAIYEQQRGQIDLVLLDYMMPEMDGEDTFHEIRRIDPTAKVLLASGYDKEGELQPLLGAGVNGSIHKPYRLHQLSRVVREVLAGD